MAHEEYKIVAIRTKYSFSSTTDEITDVKLSFGYIEPVSSVVRSIDLGFNYYYTDRLDLRAEVETVHPSYGDPYIRTKANYTKEDNLLSLPRF